MVQDLEAALELRRSDAELVAFLLSRKGGRASVREVKASLPLIHSTLYNVIGRLTRRGLVSTRKSVITLDRRAARHVLDQNVRRLQKISKAVRLVR
ncbi:MAG: hypothetical protein FJ088_15535 [Deltaproteobacteria bacterium]|nr:hypothetical protein [Deltaproteobacteria bacterium]